MFDKDEAEDTEVTQDVSAEEPDVDLDEVEAVEAEADGDEPEEQDDATEAEEEYVVVTVDGEAPTPEEEEAEKAPEWVRELRKQHREEKRKVKELEAKLKAQEQPTKTPVLGPEPEIEDFDFDGAKFKEAHRNWLDQKRQIDEAEAAERKAREAVDAEWQQKLEGYQVAKKGLRVRDYDDAEEVVKDTLSVTQQGMILQGAENPAALIYVLGKDAKRAQELASITDPVKFAFAVARLETKVKTEVRTAQSKPEKIVNGTAPVSGPSETKLNKLKADAEASGDYTAYFAYKRKLGK